MYWTVHLEGGPRRVNHAAAVVDELIYSFGGYSTGENSSKIRPMDVHVLNTGNLRWHRLPIGNLADNWHSGKGCIPFQRYGHSAVAYYKKIFIWGGRNEDSACNKIFCFDTETRMWSSPKVSGMVPVARDGHSACLINHRMYVFGGYEEDSDRFSNDVFYLDLRCMKWHYIVTKGETVKYRDFHSATAIGSTMYVFGGRSDLNGPYGSNNEEYCSDIVYLDTDTHRWHKPVTTGDIPPGRRSHSAFGSMLYVFGGFNGVKDEHFNDLHRFDPFTNEWKLIHALGKPPYRRRRQSCLVVNNKLYVFGGTSPWIEVFGDMGPANGNVPEIWPQYVANHNHDDSDSDEDPYYQLVANPNELYQAHHPHPHVHVLHHQPNPENNGGVDMDSDDDASFEDAQNPNEPVVNGDEDEEILHNAEGDGIYHGDDDDNEDDDEDDDIGNVDDDFDVDQEVDFMPGPGWVVVDPNADGMDAKLIDMNDLHVLDFSPSLYTLCMKKVIDHKLDPSVLPPVVRQEIVFWTTPNTISQ